MQSKENKKVQNQKIEQVAIKLQAHRDSSNKKLVGFPDDLKKSVADLVVSGIKPHQICKATGLSHGSVMGWVKKYSKFKPLKVVNTKKLLTDASPTNPQRHVNIRLASGAEVQMDVKLFTELLEKGVL
jgi:hypothetical protein